VLACGAPAAKQMFAKFQGGEILHAQRNVDEKIDRKRNLQIEKGPMRAARPRKDWLSTAKEALLCSRPVGPDPARRLPAPRLRADRGFGW
jgi:hypothetical protein